MYCSMEIHMKGRLSPVEMKIITGFILKVIEHGCGVSRMYSGWGGAESYLSILASSMCRQTGGVWGSWDLWTPWRLMRKMEWSIEQLYAIKFRVKLEKSATETFEMLKIEFIYEIVAQELGMEKSVCRVVAKSVDRPKQSRTFLFLIYSSWTNGKCKFLPRSIRATSSSSPSCPSGDCRQLNPPLWQRVEPHSLDEQGISDQEKYSILATACIQLRPVSIRLFSVSSGSRGLW